MLAAIALAALMFPAPEKYLYAFKTASGAEIAADVWIYGTSEGIVAHEEMRHEVPIATSDQHFDSNAGLSWYLGANSSGSQLFIRTARSTYGPWRARVRVSGKTTDIQIDRPSCLLVLDGGLTSSILLPAMVRATRSTSCTFLVADGATSVDAVIETTAHDARPARAAANDVEMTVSLAGGVTERLWYDPRALVPDYIDLGNGGVATLSATTLEQ